MGRWSCCPSAEPRDATSRRQSSGARRPPSAYLSRFLSRRSRTRPEASPGMTPDPVSRGRVGWRKPIAVALLSITPSDQAPPRQPSAPSRPACTPDRRSPAVARRGRASGTGCRRRPSSRASARLRGRTARRLSLAFGRFLDQLHPVAGEADRGSGHGYGEELAKSFSRHCLLAPMLAVATAWMLSGELAGGNHGGLPPASHRRHEAHTP